MHFNSFWQLSPKDVVYCQLVQRRHNLASDSVCNHSVFTTNKRRGLFQNKISLSFLSRPTRSPPCLTTYFVTRENMWPKLEFHMLLWLPPLYQRLNVSSCHSTSDGGKVTLVLAQHLTCQCSIKQSVFLCSSRSWPRNAVKKNTKKKKKTEATDSVTAFKFKCV